MLSTDVRAPERSLAQRMAALREANRIRVWRSIVKVRLDELDDPVLLLEDPPEWMESMKVIVLLISLPKVGRVKADRVLRREGISPSKTLGGMSDRQRHALSVSLRAYRRGEGWQW